MRAALVQLGSLDMQPAYAVMTLCVCVCVCVCVCARARTYQQVGVYAVIYVCSCIKGAVLHCHTSGVKTPLIGKMFI